MTAFRPCTALLAALLLSCATGGPQGGSPPSSDYRDRYIEDNRRLDRLLVQEKDFAAAVQLGERMHGYVVAAGDRHKQVEVSVKLAAALFHLERRPDAQARLDEAAALIAQGFGTRYQELVSEAKQKLAAQKPLSPEELRRGPSSASKPDRMAWLEQVYQSKEKPEAAIPIMLSLADEEDEDLAAFAIFVLGGHGAAALAAAERILPRLLDGREKVRTVAAMTLSAMGPGVAPALMPYLEFPDRKIKALAFLSLAGMKDVDRTLAEMVPGLSATGRRVLVEAIGTPGLYSTAHPAFDAAVRTLAAGDPAREVRQAARVHLAREGSAVAKGAVVARQQRNDEARRRAREQSPEEAAEYILGSSPAGSSEPEMVVDHWLDAAELLIGFERFPDAARALERARLAGPGAADVKSIELLEARVAAADGKGGALLARLDELFSRHGAQIVQRLEPLSLGGWLAAAERSSEAKDWQLFRARHTTSVEAARGEEAIALRVLVVERLRGDPDAAAELSGGVMLAEALRARGRLSEAAAIFRQAFAAKGQRGRVALLGMLSAHRSYADTLLALGRPADAFAQHARSLEFERHLMSARTDHAEDGGALLAVMRSYAQNQYDWLISFLQSRSPTAEQVRSAFAYQIERKGYLRRILNATRLKDLQGSAGPAVTPSVDAVIASLGADGALVDYVAYRDSRVVDGGRRSTWGPRRYGAFVLIPGQVPAWADLGEAAPIEAALVDLRATVVRPSDRAAKRKLDAARRKLHQLLLEPLGAGLDGRRRWILSPDGDLARVPFGALLDAKGRPAGDGRVLAQVLSARELTAAGAGTTQLARATLIADPDFQAEAAGADPSSVPAAVRALRWTALPGTRREAELVGKLLAAGGARTSMLLGADARRETLLGKIDADVLHVATHGFFVEARADVEDESRLAQELMMPADRGIGRITSATGKASRPARPKASPAPGAVPEVEATPLQRAGLVLAGGNREGRGVVTAEELAAAPPFTAHPLVVLSACDTGLGTSSRGEGITGLQSSLFLRGARTVLASLWRIPDDETVELMKVFYGELARGAVAAEALAVASEQLRRRHPEPYYWAAFVLIQGGR